MKTLILGIITASIALASCNSEGNKQQATDTTANSENTQAATSTNTIQGILDSYFQLKNALTQDDDKAAAAAGKEVVTALDGFDKTALNETQAKEFTEIYDDAKEHAQHIGANAGNIKHQREHFETLSQDVYDLAKTVGGGQKLYVDHCPMYNNNKGANWISETKEIKNPYLGKAMLECGEVKEELN